MTVAITEYALLSDCRICALVSRRGSLDWLCLPEPSSPSLFGALLDEQRGGRWAIEPERVRETTRWYANNSAVLITEHRCESGVVRVTDSLQISAPGHEPNETLPDHEITREVHCVLGEVDVRVEFHPAPGYARGKARLRDSGAFGILVEARRQTTVLRTDINVGPVTGRNALAGGVRLRGGDRRIMALTHTMGGPLVAPMLGRAARTRTERTVAWWDDWSGSLRLPGHGRELVKRSAITLRSLVYAPTGAVLAAPTTSLPEVISGRSNWDYRYCWCRDASLAMRALLNLGVRTEARSFFSWLIDASRPTRPRLSVLYDVHGRALRDEHTLRSLRGYAGSRPVRVGNAAGGQLQLDTYGALLDAAWQHHRDGGSIDSAVGRMLRDFVRTAMKLWTEPDAGIWELRSGPRHHTLSKAMCWVAMDRGMKLAKAGVLRIDRESVEHATRTARREIERHGYNPKLRSYTATFDGERIDASLLLLSVYGFEEPDSERMLGTIDRIYERLGVGPSLYRYQSDGSADQEGCFGICGFWGVEALALAGRLGAATEYFNRLCAQANDVGLFAEEFQVEGSHARGNFPQALTHIGLINAAFTLDRARAPTEPMYTNPQAVQPT